MAGPRAGPPPTAARLPLCPASPALPALSSQLAPQREHLAERAHDDADVAARLLSRLTRVVMETDFADRRPPFASAREHLDVDQRAGAAQIRQQCLHERSPVNLE